MCYKSKQGLCLEGDESLPHAVQTTRFVQKDVTEHLGEKAQQRKEGNTQQLEITGCFGLTVSPSQGGSQKCA